MLAAASSSLECVKLLLQAGADLGSVNSYGGGVLHYAVSYSDNEYILQYLITAGTSLEQRDQWGDIPLSFAAAQNNIVSANILLNCGADIDNLNFYMDPPLHESLNYRQDDLTELLLSRGASYTLPFSREGSILHIAAKSGGLRTLKILDAAILKGIDTELANKEGKTALQVAQQREEKEVGFLEKFHTLIVDIRARNAAQIQEASSSRSNNTNISPPNQINVEPRMNTQLATLFWITWAFIWSTLEKLREVHFKNPIRLSWTSILIYLVLGLGWAGFIYVTFGPGQSGGSRGERTDF